MGTVSEASFHWGSLMNQSSEAEITYPCDECGKDITFPGDRRGHVEICPECGEYVDVPNEPTSCRSPSLPPVGGNDTKESCLAASGWLWFEVLAVLCLAVFPDLFGAIAAVAGWVPQSKSLVYQELWSIVRAVQVSVPLLLILKLTGEPWVQFGLVRVSWFLDVPVGGAVWMCNLVIWLWVMSLVPEALLAGKLASGVADWAKPEGFPGYILLLVASLANGFAEEFVMRGYLLTRLERLLHSTWRALLASSFLFASYHLYQGTSGLISATVTGLLYGGVFCLTRRLWPICVAHAITDFVALI